MNTGEEKTKQEESNELKTALEIYLKTEKKKERKSIMKINKNEMIITIDSELGSNGDKIADELSQILGIPCYGEEILDRASEISGIPYKLMHRYDGRTVHAAYDLLVDSDEPIKIAPAADFVTAQVFAARQLASAAPCILVDRHANAALAGNKNHISIFIHADFEDRAKVFASQKGLSETAAVRSLKKADRAYGNYYRGNNKGWGDAGKYDMTVNASDADTAAVAEMIVSFLETMTGMTLRQEERQKKVG